MAPGEVDPIDAVLYNMRNVIKLSHLKDAHGIRRTHQNELETQLTTYRHILSPTALRSIYMRWLMLKLGVLNPKDVVSCMYRFCNTIKDWFGPSELGTISRLWNEAVTPNFEPPPWMMSYAHYMLKQAITASSKTPYRPQKKTAKETRSSNPSSLNSEGESAAALINVSKVSTASKGHLGSAAAMNNKKPNRVKGDKGVKEQTCSNCPKPKSMAEASGRSNVCQCHGRSMIQTVHRILKAEAAKTEAQMQAAPRSCHTPLVALEQAFRNANSLGQRSAPNPRRNGNTAQARLGSSKSGHGNLSGSQEMAAAFRWNPRTNSTQTKWRHEDGQTWRDSPRHVPSSDGRLTPYSSSIGTEGGTETSDHPIAATRLAEGIRSELEAESFMREFEKELKGGGRSQPPANGVEAWNNEPPDKRSKHDATEIEDGSSDVLMVDAVQENEPDLMQDVQSVGGHSELSTPPHSPPPPLSIPAAASELYVSDKSLCQNPRYHHGVHKLFHNKRNDWIHKRNLPVALDVWHKSESST